MKPSKFPVKSTKAIHKKIWLILPVLLGVIISFGQDSILAHHSPTISQHNEVSSGYVDGVNKNRVALVTGINAGVYGGSLFILHRAWYKDEARTSFQVFNDSKEWLQVDKVGHAWTAYNTGRASTMLW